MLQRRRGRHLYELRGKLSSRARDGRRLQFSRNATASSSGNGSPRAHRMPPRSAPRSLSKAAALLPTLVVASGAACENMSAAATAPIFLNFTRRAFPFTRTGVAALRKRVRRSPCAREASIAPTAARQYRPADGWPSPKPGAPVIDPSATGRGTRRGHTTSGSPETHSVDEPRGRRRYVMRFDSRARASHAHRPNERTSCSRACALLTRSHRRYRRHRRVVLNLPPARRRGDGGMEHVRAAEGFTFIACTPRVVAHQLDVAGLSYRACDVETAKDLHCAIKSGGSQVCGVANASPAVSGHCLHRVGNLANRLPERFLVSPMTTGAHLGRRARASPRQRPFLRR